MSDLWTVHRSLERHATVKDMTACATCQEDLAGAIDKERSDGRMASIQAYPMVWAHLLMCPSCAETYRLVVVLVDADAAGLLLSIHTVLEGVP